MSNLSRHRNKLIAGAVIATAGGLSAVSSASPLLNVKMVGWDISTSGAAPAPAAMLQNIPVVNPGDTVVYAILTYLAPVGTTNSSVDASHLTGHTITATTLGKDGINSLSFDAYQLASDQIQVDFKNTLPTSTTSISGTTLTLPAQGMTLSTGPNGNGNTQTPKWTGTGHLGGALGHQSTGNVPGARTGANNDLIRIRPVEDPGTFRGITSTQPGAFMGTGLFVVAAVGDSSTTPVRMRYTPSGAQGGNGGGFAINGQTDIPNVSDTSELGADPFMGFTPLTLGSAVPEPGSLSLLGLAAAGLLARRKNKKA